jgi:23S rRNA (adenine-N6)-dimethyltransferase
MSARRPRRSRPNPAGVHHLRSGPVLRALVRSADPRPADAVYELGAGPGTLTAALARSGAAVTAIERDPIYARELRRRFRDHAHVRVVEADLRRHPIPRNAKVVANLPFATSSTLVARLLDPPGPPRAGVDLLVERGFALRLSARLQRSPRTAWWAARYDIRLTRTVPSGAFDPPPGVEAALLRIRARRQPALDPAAERLLQTLLAAVHRRPDARAATLARHAAGRRAGPRLLHAAGADPQQPAGLVAPHAWAAVAAGAAPLRR